MRGLLENSVITRRLLRNIRATVPLTLAFDSLMARKFIARHGLRARTYLFVSELYFLTVRLGPLEILARVYGLARECAMRVHGLVL
jgi:hypothetical protein